MTTYNSTMDQLRGGGSSLSLDYLASVYGITRKSGENDESLRFRVRCFLYNYSLRRHPMQIMNIMFLLNKLCIKAATDFLVSSR